MNIVGKMDDLAKIRPEAAALQQTADFDTGARYVDFDPKTDKLASYGIAGMIAAGGGVLLAKKLGLLAVALVFLKKFIAIAIAAPPAAQAGSGAADRPRHPGGRASACA